MRKNLKSTNQQVEEFFNSPATTNQKAWGLINHFYHLVLTYMENNGIKQSDLAARLGVSRSAVSQLFKKTPNISIKKMVEIADAVGINFTIESTEVTSRSARSLPSTSKRRYLMPHEAKIKMRVYEPTKKLKSGKH